MVSDVVNNRKFPLVGAALVVLLIVFGPAIAALIVRMIARS